MFNPIKQMKRVVSIIAFTLLFSNVTPVMANELDNQRLIIQDEDILILDETAPDSTEPTSVTDEISEIPNKTTPNETPTISEIVPDGMPIASEIDPDDTIAPGVWSDQDPYFTDGIQPITESSIPLPFSRQTRSDSAYPTYQEAYETMISLQSTYPEGMVWTNFEPYGSKGTQPYYLFKGGAIKGAALGVGCAALAFIFSDTVFGNLPARVVDAGNFTFEDLKVGDILRVNSSHFVIILRITANGVILVEGNFCSTVHWGRAMSKDEIMASTNFVVTRYPENYSETDHPDEIVQNGTEGNLSWTLTQSGNLTISGSSAMPDYTETSRPSWETYSDKIYNVTIEPGITSIGNYAFYQTTSLINAYLPDSLTRIGTNAFQGTNLIAITIPGNVQTIDDNAFCDCASLTSATVSEGVQTIGISAFKHCSSLKYIDFPSSITSLGSGAFTECETLTQIRFAPGTNIVSIGDNLFSRCYYLDHVTLPLKADKISSGMFGACGLLTYLYIPSGIQDIEGVGGTSGSPFAGTNLQVIDFGGTRDKWQSINGPSALTYAGLAYPPKQTTVNFEVDFDNPFAPLPDDPGDITFPCQDGHVGTADSNGNCNVCGDPMHQEEKPVDPSPTEHEHTYGDWIIDLAATTEQTGSKHRDCTICQYRQTEEIPKTTPPDNPSSNNPDDNSNNADQPNRPDDSGSSLQPEVPDTHQHIYDAWVVDQPATAERNGQRHRTCRICLYQQIESIPATGLAILPSPGPSLPTASIGLPWTGSVDHSSVTKPSTSSSDSTTRHSSTLNRQATDHQQPDDDSSSLTVSPDNIPDSENGDSLAPVIDESTESITAPAETPDDDPDSTSSEPNPDSTKKWLTLCCVISGCLIAISACIYRLHVLTKYHS